MTDRERRDDASFGSKDRATRAARRLARLAVLGRNEGTKPHHHHEYSTIRATSLRLVSTFASRPPGASSPPRRLRFRASGRGSTSPPVVSVSRLSSGDGAPSAPPSDPSDPTFSADPRLLRGRSPSSTTRSVALFSAPSLSTRSSAKAIASRMAPGVAASNAGAVLASAETDSSASVALSSRTARRASASAEARAAAMARARRRAGGRVTRVTRRVTAGRGEDPEPKPEPDFFFSSGERL